MLVILNLILVGMVIMFLILTYLDNRRIKKDLTFKNSSIQDLSNALIAQANHLNTLTKDVSQSSLSTSKMFGLIGKLSEKQREVLSTVAKDQDKIIDMIKALTESQQKSILAHNELVCFMMEHLSDIWCDICEEDCAQCPFEHACKGFDPESGRVPGLGVNEEGEPFSPTSSPIVKSNYYERGGTGSLTIDPEDDNDLNRMIEAMKASGLPDEIAQQYAVAIKQMIKHDPNHPKKMDIIWKSELVDSGKHSSKRGVSNNSIKDENKLVDPKSKIVKSLNKLFDDSK